MIRNNHYSSVAQLVERLAVNQRVVGSSPTGGAWDNIPYYLSFRGEFISPRSFARLMELADIAVLEAAA